MGVVCGVDVETTGLDLKKEWVVEIGAILFDSETWVEEKRFQVLINRPEAFPLKCVEIHGITEEMLLKEGVGAVQAFNMFQDFVKDAEMFVAHNANFDAEMLTENFKRTPAFELSDSILKKPWICSKSDVKSHLGRNCTKLSHLALDYGCVVDGSMLHRAVNDVEIMGRMLAKTKLTAQQMLEWSREPWVYLEALVEKPWVDNGRSRDLAKKEGFGWEKAPGSYEPVFNKCWVKRVKQSELENEKARNVGFKRLVLKLSESKQTS